MAPPAAALGSGDAVDERRLDLHRIFSRGAFAFRFTLTAIRLRPGRTPPTRARWCAANIMKPSFGYFGGAHATNAASQYQDYWVQVFAGL